MRHDRDAQMVGCPAELLAKAELEGRGQARRAVQVAGDARRQAERQPLRDEFAPERDGAGVLAGGLAVPAPRAMLPGVVRAAAAVELAARLANPELLPGHLLAGERHRRGARHLPADVEPPHGQPPIVRDPEPGRHRPLVDELGRVEVDGGDDLESGALPVVAVVTDRSVVAAQVGEDACQSGRLEALPGLGDAAARAARTHPRRRLSRRAELRDIPARVARDVHDHVGVVLAELDPVDAHLQSGGVEEGAGG